MYEAAQITTLMLYYAARGGVYALEMSVQIFAKTAHERVAVKRHDVRVRCMPVRCAVV